MQIDFPNVDDKTDLQHLNHDKQGLLLSYVPSIGKMIDKGYAYRLPDQPNNVFITIPSGLCCFWAFATICRDNFVYLADGTPYAHEARLQFTYLAEKRGFAEGELGLYNNENLVRWLATKLNINIFSSEELAHNFSMIKPG
jgi:hypothetical protein